VPGGADLGGTSGYCVSPDQYELASARSDLVEELEQYLREELDSGFRRYLGVGPIIDDTYATAMTPFLRSLPS
jgi:hypothetical protein